MPLGGVLDFSSYTSFSVYSRLLLPPFSCQISNGAFHCLSGEPQFLRILCLSDPILGVINMVTNCFQTLGKEFPALMITLLCNAILFIPAVILLYYLWKLNGVIAAQPIVETILMIVCIIMYGKKTAADKTAAVK